MFRILVLKQALHLPPLPLLEALCLAATQLLAQGTLLVLPSLPPPQPLDLGSLKLYLLLRFPLRILELLVSHHLERQDFQPPQQQAPLDLQGPQPSGVATLWPVLEILAHILTRLFPNRLVPSLETVACPPLSPSLMSSLQIMYCSHPKIS